MTGKNKIFPDKNQLKKATLQALKEMSGKGTTKEINSKVAQILDLSEEVLKMAWVLHMSIECVGYVQN